MFSVKQRWGRLAFVVIQTVLLIGLLGTSVDRLDARQRSVVTEPQEIQRSLIKTEGTIGAGTSSSNWYVVDSGVEGPTVLLVGGVHGNEPAGAWAAEQIRHWPIAKGKLIVLPRLNRLGLLAKTRWIPEHRNDRNMRDLNRNFPIKGSSTPQPQTDLAVATWDFVVQHRPAWVLDLHEGFDFHRINDQSVGSSVIAFPSEEALAQDLVNYINQDIRPEIHFDLLARNGPAKGSLARACGEILDAKSFIFETTFKDQPISTRTRQHRKLVSTILHRIDMVAGNMEDFLAPPKSIDRLNVGVFDGKGASEEKVVEVIAANQKIYVAHLGPADMKPVVLKQFDVLLFPGGSGSKQAKDIGAEGRESIRQFVDQGGGVVGICAGAYLCSSHYEWSLNLLDAAVFNKTIDVPGKGKKSVWYRGPAANVEVEMAPDGKEIIGLTGTHNVRYQNGPIFSPGKNDRLPPYQAMAYFRTENGIYEEQKNTMIGTPAIIYSAYGTGRVLAISPHFESTQGLETAVVEAIRYVGVK